MTSKSLRPTAIIPPEVYIERSADKELDQIVADMGRPGYVLVARQMGKTNLLFHMKRRREALGDIVAYFDLSHRYDDLRTLFRHFIDLIAEAARPEGAGLHAEIERQRTQLSLQANIEYDRHLRLILQAIGTRKVIIVLDEIDSLVSASYSDAVFAQIRSMYFSRVNYTEYERLSYVLSGVADPADLIKDRNISPFNIGQKIFLNEFEISEVEELLRRANLKLRPIVVDEIYGWTSGNPRMTWDLCSELEDRQISCGSVSPEDVREAAVKLYLDRFDRPPVDHIRALVAGDPELRNAVLALRAGRAMFLTDREKDKLYLAGVSGLASERQSAIKNRIIDAALSEGWLKEIGQQQKSLLEAARDEFNLGHYPDVIRLIESYQKTEEGRLGELPIEAYFGLGVSKQETGDYAGAIGDLRKALASSHLSPSQIIHANYSIARSLNASGLPRESIQYYEAVISTEGEYKLPAMVDCASAYLQFAPKDAAEKIIYLQEAVIAAVDAKECEPQNRAILKTLALYNLTQLYSGLGQTSMAIRCADFAITSAPVEMLPQLYLDRGSTLADLAECVARAAEIVQTERIKFADRPIYTLDFCEHTLACILSSLAELGDWIRFNELLRYGQLELYGAPRKPFELLLQLYNSADSTRDRTYLSSLLRVALERHVTSKTDPVKFEEALRAYADSAPSPERASAFGQYVGRIQERLRTASPFDSSDIQVLLKGTQFHMNRSNYEDALISIGAAKAILSSVWPDPSATVMFLSYEVAALRNLNRSTEAIKAADRLVYLIDRTKPADAQAETFVAIRRSTLDFLASPRDPFKGLGRNERVTCREVATGRVFEQKFKFVEGQLRTGVLALVRRPDAKRGRSAD